MSKILAFNEFMKIDLNRLSRASARVREQFADLPAQDALVDTSDYVLGAFYSLKCMADFPYWERKGSRLPDYAKKIQTHWKTAERGGNPGQYWLSGYFFNSALVRIAAVYDRIPKLILPAAKKDKGSARIRFESIAPAHLRKTSKWRNIYDEVNALKHDAKGLALKRKVSPDDAITALEEIAEVVEANKKQLRRV